MLDNVDLFYSNTLTRNRDRPLKDADPVDWLSRASKLLQCNLERLKNRLEQTGEQYSNRPKITTPALKINVDNKASFRYLDG